MIPILIVLTDGKANVGLKQGLSVQETISESRKMGETIGATGIQALVIDTEQGFIRLQLAEKLAKAMNAQYVRLENIDAAHMTAVIRSAVKRSFTHT